MVKLFIKAIAITLGFLILFFALTIAGLGWYGYRQLTLFTNTAGISVSELKATLKTAWEYQPTQTDHHKNILILGLDTLEKRGSVPPLSDTMMLVSVDLSNGSIRTLPLPRDIWSEDYKTKINALYAYGLERATSPTASPSTKATDLSTKAIADLTEVPIHHTLPLTLDQVAELVDLLGGVEINVEHAFVDEEFPRSDVDVTIERDPAKLYQRVEFTQGPETMTGERALMYIRSRHSIGDEGDDTARSRRQQAVIEALIKKATSPDIITQPKVVGSLYAWYQKHFAHHLSVIEAIATAKALLPYKDSLSFQGSSLSVYPEDPQGVITNPRINPRMYQGQWVFIIRDITKFRTEVRSKLGLPTTIPATN